MWREKSGKKEFKEIQKKEEKVGLVEKVLKKKGIEGKLESKKKWEGGRGIKKFEKVENERW